MITTQRSRGRTPDARQARRDSILDAIVELLREGGMAAVTTDAIAARADVSKATIYRNWPNKSEFLVAALERIIQPVDIPDMGSLEAEIRAFLEARHRQYSQPKVNRIFAAIVGASVDDPVLAATFHGWVAGQMSANMRIVQRGIARGEVDPAISLASIATMIAAPLLYRTVWERQAPSDELVETVVTCLVRALRPVSVPK